MARRVKKIFRFYMYAALLGASAFLLTLIGGSKKSATDNESLLTSFPSIPQALAEVPKVDPRNDGEDDSCSGGCGGY